MRAISAAVLAATLFVTNAFAATDSVGPLSAGRPAGVKKAQYEGNTLLWLLGASIVVGGIVLVATGENTHISSSTTGTH